MQALLSFEPGHGAEETLPGHWDPSHGASKEIVYVF